MRNLLLFVLLALPITAYNQVKPVAPPEVLTAEESDILGKLLVIELESSRCQMLPATCKDTSQELATLYAQALKSPRVIRAIAAQAVFKYQQLENQSGNKSAMQISQIVDQQNAKLIPLLIFQNQRIIELLEQIAKKPR